MSSPSVTASRTHRRSLALLLVLVCAIALTGCSGGTKTGSGVNLKPTGGGAGNLFPSTAAPRKTAAPKPRVTTAAPKPRVTTAAPRQTKQAAPPFTITIYGDKATQNKIEPPQGAVYSGTKVVWKNADTQPRGVTATNGGFKSGPIAPGGTYTWVAGAPGTYAYADSTRPYVTATITVAAT
ncbi:MAG: Cupredoxin-like domain [Frankiales bacterium]|nr:Cupredoxin-like domain [Frankiales bacterium]